MANKFFLYGCLKDAVSPLIQIICNDSKTGVLMFSEFGARLLGLFPDKKMPNVLWVPPDISEKIKAKGWLLGGERLWIAPERNFNYDKPETFDGFLVQEGMDPGFYKWTAELSYKNQFSLHDYLNDKTYPDCLGQRTFCMIDDPYKTSLAYAGVRIKDRLELNGSGINVCAWSLAQVYVCDFSRCGTALFPVKENAMPLQYFEKIPPDRTSSEKGYVRFKIDGNKIGKLAIKPEDIDFKNPVKAVYVSPFPDSDQWFCVAKRSDDLPKCQYECVDVAKAFPNGLKGAIQSYNSDSTLCFGEIELQLAKAKTRGGRSISAAAHELLSWCGGKKEILELARKLLKIRDVPEIYY